MASRNPLQDQLLKAGLVKKGKVDQVAREQARQRQGKAAPEAATVDAQALQAERAERDRALAAERKAQQHAAELRAQARQIVQTQQQRGDGDIPYRFAVDGRFETILVGAAQRARLAAGALVIARLDAAWALLAREVADKVLARDAGLIVLDHAASTAPAAEATADSDAAHYARFVVPDDLVW